jgi:hypothetical protein
MELFLFRPAEYALRYICENITVNSIPLRKQPLNGWITIALYCLFEVIICRSSCKCSSSS